MTIKSAFKWVIMRALHQKEIEHDPQRILKLHQYEDEQNWQ